MLKELLEFWNTFAAELDAVSPLTNILHHFNNYYCKNIVYQTVQWIVHTKRKYRE
jgi:hypothetical protein